MSKVLEGGSRGDYIGTTTGVIKRDARNFDYGSCKDGLAPGLRARFFFLLFFFFSAYLEKVGMSYIGSIMEGSLTTSVALLPPNISN